MAAMTMMSRESRSDLDPASIAVLARVAHEMRQPWSAATAPVTLINDDVDIDTERRQSACGVLKHQCARLFRLLDDLLVTATIGSDLTTLNKGRVTVTLPLLKLQH
jgi:signal transduction histidine kinase